MLVFHRSVTLRLWQFSAEHIGQKCLPNARRVPSSSCQLISDEAHADAVEGSPAKVLPWVLRTGSAHEDTGGTPPTEGVEPGDLLYERLMQKSHKLRESLVRSLLSSEDVLEGVERRGRDLEWDGEHDRVSPEQG